MIFKVRTVEEILCEYLVEANSQDEAEQKMHRGDFKVYRQLGAEDVDIIAVELEEG